MNNARRDAEWLAFNRPTPTPEVDSYDHINPSHYKGDRKYEPIDVIEDWGLDYHLGNALKYIARNGRKPGEDRQRGLSKAIWYLERLKDQLAEEAQCAADADALLASIDQEEREFEALGEIPSSVLFGADDPMYYEGYGKDLSKFQDTEIVFTEHEGDQILGHQKNGDVVWLGHAPRSYNYEDVITFDRDQKEAERDPYDDMPSDHRSDFLIDFDR